MSAEMKETSPEERAAALGWSPKEQYRGREENWVDAETYLERGQQIMPILKQNNKKLEADLAAQRSETEKLRAALEQSQASIEELKNFNSAMAREAAEQARVELKARLVQAKEAGDHATEVELTEQLQEQTQAIKEAKKAPDVPQKPEEPKLSPQLQAAKAEFEGWVSENPWYNSDLEKTGLANGIAQKLRAEGTELTGRKFFDEVARRVDERLGERTEASRPADKVGAGGRSSGGGGSDRGKSFAELPRDAKEACERYMSNGTIKIGKGKTFETQEAFRKHYATQYFARD